MRRACIIAMIIIICSLSLSAIDLDNLNYRGDSFMIQAAYKKACDVVVHEIAAQSASYIAGMPFNIEEDIVAYHPDDVGRRIATIDIISNTRFRLEISSNGEMKHEEEGKKTGEQLHYILTLEFLLGFYEGGHINESSTTSIRHESRSGQPTYWTISSSPDPDTFLGTVDGAIYFMFDEKSSEFIDSSDDTTLPPGNYKSTVTIRVEAIE